MTDGGTDHVAPSCTNLRQGDVVGLGSVPRAGDHEGESQPSPTPSGVAILSQTCDVVQPSKSACLVAPVLDVSPVQVADARKGRKPLHLYLADDRNGGPQLVADMGLAMSVPKTQLEGLPITAHFAHDPSGRQATRIAARIARAFGRFAFPDEVYPLFSELRSRAQSKAGSPSAFGQVVDLILDIRVSADQWVAPGRRLKVWCVIPEVLIAPIDEIDPSWTWAASRVLGAKPDELLSKLTMNRLCELIVASRARDLTTLAHLWHAFGVRLRAELLSPGADGEVASVEVEVLSETEMTYRDVRASESLDLEVLSTADRPDGTGPLAV